MAHSWLLLISNLISMRHLFTALIFFLTIFYTYGQNCPYIEFRNNGNGQSNNCPNVNGTPMAANFGGTPYAVNFIGMAKTGNIRFVFPGTITNPPAIKKIWLGSTL